MQKPRLHHLASLAVLLGSAALLVADSAGPQCRTYQGFQGTYDWETTCDGVTATGRLEINLADRVHSSGDEEDLEWDYRIDDEIERDLQEQLQAQGLEVYVAYIDYDVGSCIGHVDETSNASINRIVLAIDHGGEDYERPTCEAWTGALHGPQNLSCEHYDEPYCDLLLHPVND